MILTVSLSDSEAPAEQAASSNLTIMQAMERNTIAQDAQGTRAATNSKPPSASASDARRSTTQSSPTGSRRDRTASIVRARRLKPGCSVSVFARYSADNARDGFVPDSCSGRALYSSARAGHVRFPRGRGTARHSRFYQFGPAMSWPRISMAVPKNEPFEIRIFRDSSRMSLPSRNSITATARPRRFARSSTRRSARISVTIGKRRGL